MAKTPHKSFVTLYRKLALPLMKFIVKRVGGNQDVAEEVFSRTVAAAWEGYHTFENKAKFFTWICRIGLNKIADYYREEINRESRFVAPLLEEISEASVEELSPTERLALDELRSSVRACIKLLPEDKKKLLLLRYWRQMTIKQIAKEFGVSERAIEGRIYRAKQSLKEIFVSEYPSLSEAPVKDA